MTTRLHRTVKPVGGDYTSLAACMIANEQDLVAVDKYFDVEIAGDWSGGADTTPVAIPNYITDPTRNINIYTTGQARHNAVYSPTAYRIELLSVSGVAWCIGTGVNNLYLNIDGIQTKTSAFPWNSRPSGIAFSAIPQIVIKNCIFVGIGGGAGNVHGGNGIRLGGATFGGNVTVYNNIAYGFNKIGTGSTGGGINLNQASGTQKAFNNTIYGCELGIAARADATNTVRNNICNGNSVDYNIGGTTSKNISQDNTSPEVALRGIVLEFMDIINKDFHLSKNDIAAIDKGDDLSSIFTTDIDGALRTGAWDIGADERTATNRIAPYYYQHLMAGRRD